MAEVEVTRPDPIRVEEDQVGAEPGLDPPPVAKADVARRDIGEQAYALLDRQQAPLGVVAEQRGRVNRPAHHVQVAARVGAADNHPRVGAQPRPSRPADIASVVGLRVEAGLQRVGERDI